MPFEVFHNRRPKPGAGPTLTISARSGFSINGAASAALGDPPAVQLLYDADERIIGLRPVPRGEPNSYLVRANPGGRSFAISATSFLRHYGIPARPTVRRDAELVDGVLCVRVDDAGVPVTSNRAKSR